MLSCPYNVSYLSRRAVVVRGPGELRCAMRWSRRWRHSWSWHVEWPGLLPAGLSHCCASPLAVQSTTAVWAECWRQCRVRKLSVNDRPSNLCPSVCNPAWAFLIFQVPPDTRSAVAESERWLGMQMRSSVPRGGRSMPCKISSAWRRSGSATCNDEQTRARAEWRSGVSSYGR